MTVALDQSKTSQMHLWDLCENNSNHKHIFQWSTLLYLKKCIDLYKYKKNPHINSFGSQIYL